MSSYPMDRVDLEIVAIAIPSNDHSEQLSYIPSHPMDREDFEILGTVSRLRSPY